MPGPILNSHDSTIVVQAFVNSQGRVYDYKIVSGPEDPGVRTQIADQLLLSVFETPPASSANPSAARP